MLSSPALAACLLQRCVRHPPCFHAANECSFTEEVQHHQQLRCRITSSANTSHQHHYLALTQARDSPPLCLMPQFKLQAVKLVQSVRGDHRHCLTFIATCGFLHSTPESLSQIRTVMAKLLICSQGRTRHNLYKSPASGSMCNLV